MAYEALSPRSRERSLFEGDIVMVSHERREAVPIVPYLLNQESTPEQILSAFMPTSEWIFPASQADLLNQSVTDAMSTVLTTTRDLYLLAQQSLEGVNWFGYNDHGPAHIRSVAERVNYLANRLHIADSPHIIALVAAGGHDLGNLISRDIHSFISSSVLFRVFPNLLNTPEQAREVRKTIELHDGLVYDKVVAGLQTQGFEGEQFISRFREIAGTPGLLLLIADKTDIGRHRVNRKALSPAAIDRHAHSELNLLFETQAVDINPNDGTFNWEIEFSQLVHDVDMPRFAGLVLPADERHLYASKRVVVSQDSSEADFNKSIELLLNKSRSRINIALLSAFALDQRVQQANIIIHQINSQGEREEYILNMRREEFVAYMLEQT